MRAPSILSKQSNAPLTRAALMALCLFGLTATGYTQTPPKTSLDEVAIRLNALTAGNVAGGQVVSVTYRANYSHEILVRPQRLTTISFQGDETINEVLYDDKDAVEDLLSTDGRRLTVKLKRFLTVPGTVVTNKRVYFFILTPTQPSEPWYQGLSFDSGDRSNPFGSSRAGGGAPAPSIAEAAPLDRPKDDLFTGTPNFAYETSGNNFGKIITWDNGKFTWVQFESNIQQLPLLFALGPNGTEVVNTAPHNNGTALLVTRLMDKFVLVIGDTEVVVTATKKGK